MQPTNPTILPALSLVAALAILAGAAAQDKPETPPAAPAPAAAAEQIDTGAASLTIEARGLRTPPPPLFFSARAESTITASAKAWRSETQIHFEVLQGAADVFTLRLIGDGDVAEVAGEGIRDWAVRRSIENGKPARLLDIRPASKDSKSITATVRASRDRLELPTETSPLTLGPGKAVGFASNITVSADPSVDVRIAVADGLSPAKLPADGDRTWKFQAQGDHQLTLKLTRDGAALAPVELSNAKIEGTVDLASRSATFVLTGEARVTPPEGGSIEILSGHAAASSLPADANFTLSLHNAPGRAQPVYRLTFPQAGNFPVRIEFQAGMLEQENWRALDFKVPAGAVVPVSLGGIEKDVRFDASRSVFPTARDDRHLGFLPADGRCNLAWQAARDSEEGKLFFASDARIETRVGAGLMRLTASLDFNILQGKLDGVQILLEGSGEILSVEGDNVIGWTVNPAGGNQRLIEIQSGRPATGTERIIIRSQTPLGDFPLEATPLRLTPQGAVRHSGYLRVVSEGAVALEITNASGLIQMAPGEPPAGVRQLFVYRFPSAQHAYSISARQILPEVTVSQTTIYQMTETDRIIAGRIELDITKAPLREWTFLIPEEYSVDTATGAEVADYIHTTEPDNGMRAVKILFKKNVADRQLIQFRLARNTAAAAGSWQLPPLTFPDTKSVRGNIGVAVVAGYRVTPAKLENITEVPHNLFPFQFPGLQQTFRHREAAWAAEIQIEALPQSVQADVFHLYSLKEGIAYGSVLINYFVIGSPVSEWRINVPAEIGNIAIDGQNVQGWRRDGDQVIVTLHQPTLGAATLLLTFGQPMNARGGLLRPGQVTPAGVQGERGYIQVVSPSQVSQEIINTSAGLLKMEALELPAEFRLLSSSPSLAVYQYSSRPFDLQMNIQWFQPGETIDQVVDFATLTSHVSSDGQVVTDALFFVKTRGRKALRLKLADGTKLWESRVNGATVSAREDDGQTLIPLAASIDPSTPVQVLVRIGQASENRRKPIVTSPILLAPTLINTWTVKGDPGHRLIPTGASTPELARPVRTETGFEWLRLRASALLAWLAALIIAGTLLCCCARAGGIRQCCGILTLVIAIGISIALAVNANDERRFNLTTLEFVAPVIEPSEAVTIQLKDLAAWQSMVSPIGLIAVAIGIALLVAQFVKKDLRWLALAGWVCIAGGLLAQHGGAILFFVALAALIAVSAVYPTLREWLRATREAARQRAAAREAAAAQGEDQPATDTGGKGADPATGGVTSTILIFACALGLAAGKARAQTEDDAHPIADAATQTLRIEDGRLFGQLELAVTGRTSDTLQLLRAPAVLTEFQGDGMRITKRSTADATAYWVVIERDGTATAKISYELALADVSKGFNLPTDAAAVQHVDVRIDQAGWQITSPAAVKSEPLPNLPPGASGAHLVLGPTGGAAITLQPKSRDLASEKATFFAEVANLFIPGPGIVDGRHKITIRPSRGQLRELQCTVPDGFTVSDVLSANLGGWRFDPDAKSLHIDFNPPVSQPFALKVETQQGSATLPTELTLTPLGVQGAESQVGMLAVAFGPDAQPERASPEGLSKVNLDDFDHSLITAWREGEQPPPAPTLNQAYRYGGEPGRLVLTVAPVAPDIRAYTEQTLSLGEERLVIAVDLSVNITRSGIFKLSFPIPDGLDVEAASGPALASHTESNQNGTRVATLHLNGRTLGQQRFALTLAGPAPAPQDEWGVPKFSLREASRQTGQLLVVPEQGIRAQAAGRQHVTQLDARTLSQNHPGTLAFRLLQADWELKLLLETLDPWVTAQVLQEVTAREGLTRTHLGLAYRVENAAVKSLRIKLSGLTPDEEKTVRASGEAVRHIVKLPESDDGANVWEIHFQRRILGDGKIDIDYQRTTDRKDGTEELHIAELVSARQSAYWVAVRVSDHLEVIPTDPAPSSWQPVDWSSIPSGVITSRNRSVPDLAFRAADPAQSLTVKVQRHALADALRLRVSGGRFTTVVAPDGATVTEAKMLVEVVEKSALRVALPDGAELINAFVNGQSPGIVREKTASETDADLGTYMFYVLPREDDTAAEVSLAWSLPAQTKGYRGKKFQLTGPRLDIPLQNITWNVVLPEGYRATVLSSTLDPVGTPKNIRYALPEYLQEQQQRQRIETEGANRLMQQANQWKIDGYQEKARSAFSKLSKKPNLSAATSEDARVQLRELQSERTLLSLTTRRQRNYLDNLGEDPNLARNESLEQAADRNPLLQGATNYDPDDVDTFLAGNTSEETTALKRIANRLVSQQLAAEPALQAIDITIPKHGHVLSFSRSVQVDGDSPLELNLKVKRRSGTHLWLLIPIIGILALLNLTTQKRREE